MEKLVKCQTPSGNVVFVLPDSIEYRVRIFFLISTNHVCGASKFSRQFYLLLSRKNENGTLICPYAIAEKALLLEETMGQYVEALLGQEVQIIQADKKLINVREHFSSTNGQANHNIDFYYHFPCICNDDWTIDTNHRLQYFGENRDKIIVINGVEYSPIWYRRDLADLLKAFANPQTDPLLAQMSSYL